MEIMEAVLNALPIASLIISIIALIFALTG